MVARSEQNFALSLVFLHMSHTSFIAMSVRKIRFLNRHNQSISKSLFIIHTTVVTTLRAPRKKMYHLFEPTKIIYSTIYLSELSKFLGASNKNIHLNQINHATSEQII